MLDAINEFLQGPTPQAWLENAVKQPDILLIDHAHCEKKAASTALSLMYRYPEKTALLKTMSPLAREELLHFEKVLAVLESRNIPYRHLSPSRYAQSLFKHAERFEPQRLVDTLIIGAFIEARSCERFHALVPHVDTSLAKFFTSLLKSEARHFLDYLELAKLYATAPIDERIVYFKALEYGLITETDEAFRFHSGPCQD